MDTISWGADKSKCFTVGSYYRALLGMHCVSFPWKIIWKSRVPPRVAFFVWTAALGGILTIDNLRRRKVMVLDWCCMCKKLIIFFSIALLHGRFGPWSLVFLESIGLCRVVPWSCWNAGSVVLVIIGTSRFGELFLILWCGAFGENVMGVALRIVNGLMLRLSSSFYVPFLIGLMGGVFTLVFLFLISWSFVF